MNNIWKRHGGLITLLVLAVLAAIVLAACASKRDDTYLGYKYILEMENKK